MANQETYHWNNSGTKQSERLPKELSGDYVKIDERSFEDLIRQVAEYAKQLHYYNNNNQIDGDWSNFFSEIYDYEKQEVDMTHLEKLMENASVKPHLALMLAFLKMFQIQQENLNGITGRHLDFHYKDILGFKPQKGEVGKATVFFELNKNTSHAFIPKGTLFVAGKDEAGKPIHYEAADEMSVNRIKIASVKTYSETNGLVEMEFSSSKENAEKAEAGSTPDSISNSPETPNKPYKIIIASPILNQPDGTKSIKLLDKNDDEIELPSDCKLDCTASQGWETIDDPSSINVAIVSYNPTLHGEGFDTTHPLLRFSTSDAKEFNNLISNIKNLTVTVKGSQNCMIENKYGTFLNKAGLYPFGTIAAKGDWFKIILLFENANINSTNIPIETGNSSIWKDTQFEKKKDAISSSDNQLYSLGTDDFNQTVFASEYALAMARFVVNRDESTIPKKPFIPEFKEPVKVTYSVSDSAQLKLFSQTPFGIENINASNGSYVPKVIPFICSEKSDESESNRCQALFIGLENAESDDLLNLYLHINPYCDLSQDEDIQWSYLASSAWKGYTNSNLLKDSTEKLRHSGIVTLRLPADADTIDGLKWIKLSTSSANIDGKPFDNILEMRTQALELEYSTLSGGAASVGIALPASTITKAVSSITGIKKIEQPYNGEPGKCDESNNHFKCRVSERLRHKGRAWTGWDYERLVLEKFPKVAAAKCLSCCNEKGELEAGTVTIILLPGKDEIALNPLEPKVNGRTIAEAKSYLESIAPPFVSIHVINPDYVPIEIECTVKLREGFNDKEYYKTLLNEQIINYLSPWSNGEKDMEFSTSFNESGLIEFIDSQHFVDNVEILTISINDETIENGFYFTPSNPKQILTSAKEHKNIQFR